MIFKNFHFIEISPEESRNMKPDLPVLEEHVFDSQRFQSFLKKVEESVLGMDFKELNLLIEDEDALPTATIYITYGIKPLYDAWTVSSDDETKIFLNADGFEYNFEKQDALIIIHELVHLLIEKKLPKMDENDFLGQYHRIMIDEGLAHFLSFPYRDKILNYNEHYADRKKSTEEKFFESQRLLISNITDEDKKRILVEGNTGAYWDKHASIFGLFLFADIFKNGGLSACIDRLKSFSSFPNLSSLYSNDLHDYPENPTHLRRFIKIEEKEIYRLSGDEKYKRISRLAVHYRQLRNYNDAHKLFNTASRYFENTNPQMEMVNYLRWGDVFRFEKRFDEAWDILKKAEQILLANQFIDYQDFYLQHLGKLFFDKGEYEKALECFEKAHVLRIKKANPELISSTEFALEVTKQKMKS